jgi:hypothetical protein
MFLETTRALLPWELSDLGTRARVRRELFGAFGPEKREFPLSPAAKRHDFF